MKRKTKNSKTKILKAKTLKTATKRKKNLKVLKSKTVDRQERLEVDSFLIDEQINYSPQIEEAKTFWPIRPIRQAQGRQAQGRQSKGGVEPVINELDKLIEGENVRSNFAELLPQNEIKIFLSKKGQSIRNQKTHQTSNSAHLLNLKKKQETRYKLVPPQKSALEKFFSKSEVESVNKVKKPEAEKEHFNLPAPSLLETKKFVESLAEFGTMIGRPFSAIWRPSKKEIKTIKAANPLPAGAWLTNFKLALNFALVALILILPIRLVFFSQSIIKTKGQVLGISEVAMEELKQGAEAASQLNWQQASLNFSSANSYFIEAQESITQYNQTLFDLLKIIPATGKKITSAENLLSAGQYLTRAANDLAEVFSQSQQISDVDQALTDGLASIQEGLFSTTANLEMAMVKLSQVDVSIMPDEYQDYFSQIQLKLPELQSSLTQSQELFNFVLEFLGHREPKRYLFMFQNTNEPRPTGGFFGSFAEVEIKKGEIVNMEVPPGGTYDLKGYFTEKVISPQPLQLLGSAWQAWDANWFFDFPTSAKKINWFFENSGWPTFDGIVAINSSMIPKLLEIVGNIELPEYNKVLTPDNVVLALQHATLFEYDPEENQPKAIIRDMMPILVKGVLNIQTGQTLPLILTLNQAFKEKEIQFNFSDPVLQKQASAFNWTGEILDTEGDYLAIIDANIGGGKSNAYLTQQINDYIYIQEDGTIIKTVAVTRSHHGDEIDISDANYVFAKDRNVSYLSLIVPLGSELLEVTGYNPPPQELFKDVYPEYYEDEFLKEVQGEVTIDPKTGTRIYSDSISNKTVFGNWVQADPGQEATITFSYKLPDSFQTNESTLDKFLGREKTYSYSMLLQKQSGAHDIIFKSYLFIPENFEVKWLKSINGGYLEQTERSVNFSTNLTTDQYYAAVLRAK